MNVTLTSESLTKALTEVKSKVRDGLTTVNKNDVSADSREVIRSSYFDLKNMMENIVARLSLESLGLHLKMGRYAPNGKYVPYLWCAIIPESVKAPSFYTPQLYVFRGENMLGWGICPSDAALENVEFMNVYRAAIRKSESTIRNLFKNGFVAREHSDAGNRLQDKEHNNNVDAFFESETNTFYRVFNVNNFPRTDDLESVIESDLRSLLPLFSLITKACMENSLMHRLNESSAPDSIDDEKADHQAPRESGWHEQWHAWFDGNNNAEAKREVPNYLQAEIGTKWKTLRQRWDTGRRESLHSLLEHHADRVHALLFGSLQRTQFSGEWRIPLEKQYANVIKLISDFAKKYPNGCTNDNVSALISNVQALTGFELKSFITRVLCDICPQTYLPLSSFTVDSLHAAAPLLGTSSNMTLRKDDYEAICKEAIRLAALFPDLASTTPLYIFDHFLSWIDKQYVSVNGASTKANKIIDVNIQYWTMAPGENARLWDECREKSIISIGWDEMGDLSAYSSPEQLKDKYLELYKPENDPVMRTKCLYEFSHSLKVNDIVFMKQGVSRFIGCGRVTSDYTYDSTRKEHKHTRKVVWLSIGDWFLPDDERVNGKTLTNITKYSDLVQTLLNMTTDKENLACSAPQYSIDDAMKEVFLERPDFQAMVDALSYKKNVILQGPPGVGKTYAAKRLAYTLIGKKDDSRIGLVQFHPSYSYEDFVQGIKPNDNGFQIKNGIFLDFCAQARTSRDPFVVIIDEINRGNLSKVFGELLMLIEKDKRSERVRLTYSQENEYFSVPDNLYIIGTMNTADRSLSLVDYAKRRRFLFFTLKPELKSIKFATHLKQIGLTDANVSTIQDKIGKLNSLISADRRCLGSGFEIGHSYFSSKESNISFDTWFANILALEIEPLLKEYWFDELEKVEEVTKVLKAA